MACPVGDGEERSLLLLSPGNQVSATGKRKRIKLVTGKPNEREVYCLFNELKASNPTELVETTT